MVHGRELRIGRAHSIIGQGSPTFTYECGTEGNVNKNACRSVLQGMKLPDFNVFEVIDKIVSAGT
jgi:hypothetical protein